MMNLAAATTNHPARNHFMLPSGLLIPVGLKIFVWATLIITLLVFSVEKASGAITIVTLTQTEYNDQKSDVIFAWSAQAQAGAEGSPDIQSRSEAVLGTNTQTEIGQHVWNKVNTFDIQDTVQLTYNNSGDITLNLGGVSSYNVQPTKGFNTIFGRLADSATAGTTQFVGGSIESTEIQDFSANEGYTYFRINLGEDSPEFNLQGTFKSTFGASTDTTHILFEGFQTNPIPEPSALLLATIGFIPMFRRNRKN